MGLKLPSFQIETAIQQGLRRASDLYVKKIYSTITTGSRTGRIYGTHRASAPGEPPANRSGRLAKSYEYEMKGNDESAIGSELNYAKYLEKGTRYMEPRPHLAVTIENNIDIGAKALHQYIIKQLC